MLDKAEFDAFADDYAAEVLKFIRISGEKPDFFAEYKIADTAKVAAREAGRIKHILDFGSGTGTSVPWFRKYFPSTQLTCSDPSGKSLEISRQRFPGPESYVEISGDKLPLPDNSVDLAFTACVFHHIPPPEHVHWFKEIRRVTRPGGLFVIFEHNPWNPLTVHLVNNCALDVNAKLISAPRLRADLENAQWKIDECRYRMFFPKPLAALRPFEKYLKRIPLGAQYFVVARNPDHRAEPSPV